MREQETTSGDRKRMGMNRFAFVVCLSSLMVFGGCGQEEIGTYPPSSGDFVENLDGRGTAKVWGIEFEVLSVVGSLTRSQFEGGLHSDPEKTDAQIDINLGDDVAVHLEKRPGSGITFQLNGKSYGSLEVGDKVLIDSERAVQVNDVSRQPE